MTRNDLLDFLDFYPRAGIYAMAHIVVDSNKYYTHLIEVNTKAFLRFLENTEFDTIDAYVDEDFDLMLGVNMPNKG